MNNSDHNPRELKKLMWRIGVEVVTKVPRAICTTASCTVVSDYPVAFSCEKNWDRKIANRICHCLRTQLKTQTADFGVVLCCFHLSSTVNEIKICLDPDPLPVARLNTDTDSPIVFPFDKRIHRRFMELDGPCNLTPWGGRC